MLDTLLLSISDNVLSHVEPAINAVSAAAAQSDNAAGNEPEKTINSARVIWSISLGVAALFVMILKFKIHPFITLLMVSMGTALGAGVAPMDTISLVESGMAKALGFIAIVVGLGAMFGRMLEVSGGAESLARSTVRIFGEKNTQWAMALTGFLISIPIFLDVGLVIIIPIIYSLSKKAGKPLMYYGIPLLAGLAVAHSFIPPTPGPMIAVKMLEADVGWVILFAIIAGLPATILAGPIFGRYIADKVTTTSVFSDNVSHQNDKDLPGFGVVVGLILLPLFMILIGTLVGLSVTKEELAINEANNTYDWKQIVQFICHPFTALIIVSLLAFYVLGKFKGYTREEVQDIATKSLEPAGIIILVTGAGGVFKSILSSTGVGEILGAAMKAHDMSPLIAAFLIATMIRVAQGSATVAMVTTCGIMFPINQALGITGHTVNLMVIAIAAGATMLSHVNDSGFWLVNRFFGMTVKDTLKSWTVCLTIIGLVGFGMTLLLSLFFK